jgi:AcrR family transcriptional regulator
MSAEPKIPFKPRLKRPERRALIERAASQLIAERGYDAASLEEITSAAGISKSVLYDHFSSKAELQISLLNQNSDALMAFVAERVAFASGPQSRLLAGIEAFFEFVETHPFAWRTIFRDPPSDPRVAEACIAMHRNVTRGIAAMFRTEPEVAARIESGDDERLEMLAEQLKMAMGGLAAWWYEHRERDREEMVAALMDLAWLGIERLAAGERWDPLRGADTRATVAAHTRSGGPAPPGPEEAR